MQELETSKGIIGLFDILGYSNFLENNEPQKAAQIISDIQLKLEQNLGLYQHELFDEEKFTNFHTVFKKIKWLIFSDTILLSLSYENDMTESDKGFYWFLFAVNANLLYCHLFQAGMPLRGAIAFGEYIVQENCFAGRNIINAYKLIQQLDFAGVVIDKTAYDEINTLNLQFRPLLMDSMISTFYDVPVKSNTSFRMLTLNPLRFLPSFLDVEVPMDIKQFVSESFWKHNKNFSSNVYKKVENTEYCFRFFKMRRDQIRAAQSKLSKSNEESK